MLFHKNVKKIDRSHFITVLSTQHSITFTGNNGRCDITHATNHRRKTRECEIVTFVLRFSTVSVGKTIGSFDQFRFIRLHTCETIHNRDKADCETVQIFINRLVMCDSLRRFVKTKFFVLCFIGGKIEIFSVMYKNCTSNRKRISLLVCFAFDRIN